MLKVKIKDGKEYVSSKIKGRDTTLLESIILLHMSLTSLKDDYGLNMEQITELYKQYKNNLKEVS